MYSTGWRWYTGLRCYACADRQQAVSYDSNGPCKLFGIQVRSTC